ncbi:hypothetical protein P4O66_003697 [Electrophorus voltai]|uniref:PABC domain-containing protein n=1 Tax=Electrophorus voltai TaxID=2609070 RepID=A0AAD8YRQ3_9TELE|nr:hypothetical protein P4O66_003697 [Electrophorus voltai]
MTEMNGRVVGTKPLYVALAQRKEERQAHLSNKYMKRTASVSALPNLVLNPYQPAPAPPATTWKPFHKLRTGLPATRAGNWHSSTPAPPGLRTAYNHSISNTCRVPSGRLQTNLWARNLSLPPCWIWNLRRSRSRCWVMDGLFPVIQNMHPNLAGTGLRLEIDNSELLHMLESPESH